MEDDEELEDDGEGLCDLPNMEGRGLCLYMEDCDLCDGGRCEEAGRGEVGGSSGQV